MAVWGTRALVALAPADMPRRESIAVDWRIAAVVIGIGTALGLVARVAPALWSTRTRLSTLLRNAAVRGGGGGQATIRRAMVVAPVALSLVLLTAGGLVAPLVDFIAARRGYFDALRIRVLSGSTFTDAATPAALREVLIDRTLAEEFFPTGSAVGARLRLDTDTLTVVGVVEHARQYDVHKDGRPQIYFRDDYSPVAGLSFVVRTDRPAESLASEAREAIRRIDPQLAVADVRSMDRIVGDALRQSRGSLREG